MSRRPRNVQLVRTLQVWRFLDGLRYAPHLSELALKFQVSERTMRRDLDALEEAEFPLPIWRFN